jgi:hypothetical protein
LILLPALPPTLLTSPIVSNTQLASSIHNDTTERDYRSKEHISDEYIQNSKITNEMQSFNSSIVKPIPKDVKSSNKLFDQHESNNILYLEQGKKDKKEQMSHKENRFKCFYCDQLCSSNNDRVQHIENEHSGKLYYPTPKDSQDRLNRILARDTTAQNSLLSKHHDDDKSYPKSREEVVKEEREEAKRRILEENPHIAKDTLEFMLSLSKERRIPKVTEQETVHATAEQQAEMERLLKKKNE